MPSDESHSQRKILVYADGACSGNPGPGGWGSIVAIPSKDAPYEVRELGAFRPSTTNNQMEMTAILEALRLLAGQSQPVLVMTDSVYVIRGITQWVFGWMRRGWKTAEGNDVQNQEIWIDLLEAVRAIKSKIEWRYVRGHTGIHGNERCDEIAVAFSKKQSFHLFRGTSHEYHFFDITEIPEGEPLPEMKERAEKKAAFSYLSLLGGVPERHATWAECERRTKGKSGAKFKKAMSESEEAEILKSWGIDPAKLK